MAVNITQDLFPQLMWIATIVATPVLTLLAYNGWTNRVRKDLPRWRNALAAMSIVVTATGWLSFIFFLIVARLLRLSTHFFDMNGIAPSALVAVVGACLAIALKGRARFQAFLAAFLLAIYWTMNLVAL
jgi:hypothetical protein